MRVRTVAIWAVTIVGGAMIILSVPMDAQATRVVTPPSPAYVSAEALLTFIAANSAPVTRPAQAPSTMVLTFPSDTVLNRVVAAVSVRNGYPVTIQNPKDPTNPDAQIPNPQSRREFVRLYLAGIAIRETREHEQAAETAKVAPVVPVVIN